MMIRLLILIPLLLYISSSNSVLALDVDSRSIASDSDAQSGLKSGRYTVKKKSTTIQADSSISVSSESSDYQIRLKKEASFKSKKTSSKKSESPTTPLSIPTETVAVVSSEAAPVSAVPTVAEPSATPTAAAPAVTSVDAPTVTAEPVATPVQTPASSEYVQTVHPEDTRLNHIEFELAPGYYLQNSTSSYSTGNYSMVSTSISTSARIWLAEDLAVSGNYMTTLNASVAEVNSASQLPAKTQKTNLGLWGRHYNSNSRKSISFLYGLLYTDTSFSTTDSLYLPSSLGLSGLGLGFIFNNPSTAQMLTSWGVQYYPKLAVNEKSSSYSMGDLEASALSISYGNSFVFDRRSQIFANFIYNYQRLFTASQPSKPDPISGATPMGVQINKSSLILELGYRWGE